MATYVASPPTGGVFCRASELVIKAPDERTAIQTAQDAKTDYVQQQVEGVAQTALWRSKDLEKQIAEMKDPYTCYALGKGTSLFKSYWFFPFQVYIVDRGRP